MTISHTWLPSHTGPTVLMTTRRSLSSRPRNGNKTTTPRSNPSATTKPIITTPSSNHQMNFKLAKSSPMLRPLAPYPGSQPHVLDEQEHIHDGQGGVEQHKPAQADHDVRFR